SGAVAERGGDPGEESPHTTRGESRRVRGRAEATAQGGERRWGGADPHVGGFEGVRMKKCGFIHTDHDSNLYLCTKRPYHE
ncbi:hypothetical protein, partial [Paramuribaculum intestinale]|uniref:hypothetical protein n=1 Tax=Paramuribaculum intestinale TaxID=2094151 RepID=UPI00272B579D